MALLNQTDAAIDRERRRPAQRQPPSRVRERYRQFRVKKDTAYYHETQFAVLDPSVSRDATGASAKVALEASASGADDDWTLGAARVALRRGTP